VIPQRLEVVVLQRHLPVGLPLGDGLGERLERGVFVAERACMQCDVVEEVRIARVDLERSRVEASAEAQSSSR
jgi:hypothetical protein